MPLTSTYYNTLIDPATVIYYNCGKDSYFILSCLEPKNTGDIKEIKKVEEDFTYKSGIDSNNNTF